MKITETFLHYIHVLTTNKNVLFLLFIITTANLTDLTIVALTVWMWETILVYEGDIKRELFNAEEDKGYEIRFMANIIYDVIDDTFHFDYLMATITAFLWIRIIVLLKLTE